MTEIRAIDADALRAELMDAVDAPFLKEMSPSNWVEAYKAFVRALDRAPTLDYAPVRHGEWIEDKREYPEEVIFRYKCSDCGRTELVKEPYCHCGCLMDGGRKDENT